MKTANAETPGAPTADRERAALQTMVEQVVSQGRHAIASTEIKLAEVEHMIVAARSALDQLRGTMDSLETAGERVGGRGNGRRA